MSSIRTKSLAVAGVATLTMFTAACGSSDDTSSSDSSSSAAPSATATTPSASSTDDAAMADLVGPGCADYAKAVPSGSGSVNGMAQDPVATAASNNPLLKVLTAAVSGKVNKKVDLVDTLNGSEFTVFAPVDDAFAKIDKKTLATLAKPSGAKTLSTILTYHVIPGQIAPDKIDGTFKTVEGEKLKVSGSGDSISVGGGQASVICGGVKTANATVYLIDTVMMPPSMS